MRIKLNRLLDFLDKEHQYNKDDNVTYGEKIIIEHAIWRMVLNLMDKGYNHSEIRKLVYEKVGEELNKWLRSS